MMKTKIRNLVNASIDDLYENDEFLITHNVSERSITHKLAEYFRRRLEPIFNEISDLSVDCEYNRDVTQGEGHSKEIKFELKEQTQNLQKRFADKGDEEGLVTISTYPDIIIHKRGHNKPTNLLIVEVKKENSSVSSEQDHMKLKVFTNQAERYGYRYGIFMVIHGSKEKTQSFIWFINGMPVSFDDIVE
jgi:hypothetical protein